MADEKGKAMLRSTTGALSALGLVMALVGAVVVFSSGGAGLVLGVIGFALSGGSLVQRDATPGTRNVAALGALASTATICAGFIRL